MIRMLLATTALATVLATASLAQDASSSASSSMNSSSSSVMDTSSSSAATDASSSSAAADTSSSASGDMSASSAATSHATDTAAAPSRKPVEIVSGYTRVDTDLLATKIIGSAVYDSKAKDANKLGDINDLVLDQNGQVAAVVVGVGGFLGLGEKQVAVDFAALQFVIADDNTERYVLNTTKDELTAAPDFQTVDDQPNQASSASDQAAPSSSSAAQ